jgi:hypothetical protein
MQDSIGSPVDAVPAVGTRKDMWASPGIAVAAIWISTVLFSIFAPDMVTGSEHEHLPMAAMTGWLWALVATGFVLMGARAGHASRGLALGTAITWALVCVAVIFGPTMVTGSDPTTIPLTAMIAPIVGAFVTGFIALDNLVR